MSKPFSEACEENKAPILEVIAARFADARRVLEIGSGTGQHAVHFAAALPWLTWQTSDVIDNLTGIRLWLAEAGLPNLPPPLRLDVSGPWPGGPFDACFSANTAHIMGLPAVEAMFAGVGRVLAPGRPFALYGPFSDGGRHTAPSNARFDAWLRERDPQGRLLLYGVRYRSFAPAWGLHPSLGAQSPVRLELHHPALAQSWVVTLHEWRPDGGAYPGLPRDLGEAACRRAERVTLERVESVAPPAPGPATAPAPGVGAYCVDLRRLGRC